MMAALLMTAELLAFQPQSSRADGVLAALAKAAPQAGVHVTTTTAYQGGSDLLVLWGPGDPSRFAPMRQQLAAGGHVVCCDLAYWDRHRKMRVSIDAAHPQAWVMRREWPLSRVAADRITVADRWDPRGPVIVAGIGRKARVQYGDAVANWEAAIIAEATRRGSVVRYRRKQIDAPVPAGVPLTSDGPIEDVLRGASLLATWHSNVAVDAIRLGVPVICRDGAAAAVCPSSFGDQLQPLPITLRDRFLANLAWFQWNPQAEASAAWGFLRGVLA